jgi:low affinity Fe/Cu permease
VSILMVVSIVRATLPPPTADEGLTDSNVNAHEVRSMRRFSIGTLKRPGFTAGWHGPRCDRFERLAAWAVQATGGRWGFRIALALYLVWVVSGHYFEYSEAWRLTFFMGTSSVTFLTVFLARNAQIRSAKALHLKLDELIFAVKRADNGVIESEELAETELDRMRGRYHRLARAEVPVRSTARPSRRTAGRSDRAARDVGSR